MFSTFWEIIHFASFRWSPNDAPSLIFMVSAKAYKNQCKTNENAIEHRHRSTVYIGNCWKSTGISTLFCIAHFHVLNCKLGRQFWLPICDFQLFGFAYKTNAKSIKSIVGVLRRDRNVWFQTGFYTVFSVFGNHIFCKFPMEPESCPKLNFCCER